MSTAMLRSRELAKKASKPEEEKGFPLAPSKKDLNPWYSGTKSGEDDLSDEKRYVGSAQLFIFLSVN